MIYLRGSPREVEQKMVLELFPDRKKEYKKYYRHRRSVGCRPLTYDEWLDWKARMKE